VLSFGREGELRTIEDPGADTLPYGVAIATGALAWWFWGQGFTNWLLGR
jgi:prepilin signal peptidase PulO-like enzyme (type II secretory pathway)